MQPVNFCLCHANLSGTFECLVWHQLAKDFHSCVMVLVNAVPLLRALSRWVSLVSWDAEHPPWWDMAPQDSAAGRPSEVTPSKGGHGDGGDIACSDRAPVETPE